jgi:phosphoribosylaminoimidazolecarboxamide formyltransferase/IMP cyclohydrolase
LATAFLSVCDKTGVVELAKQLRSLGYDIIFKRRHCEKFKRQFGPMQRNIRYNGFPEMLDEEIKTLNPKIHGGILAEEIFRNILTN